jgi:LysR family glycine cleavage system transcriptional activator
LFDQQMIVVGSVAAARRLAGASMEKFAREPLLGEDVAWEDWFAEAGLTITVRPVASFNDAGLMLQAAEQGLGIAISREMLAADALVAGRLVKLSPVTITHPDARPYHFVYPPHLAQWPPLVALREWLTEEIAASQRALRAAARPRRRLRPDAPA